MYILYFQAWAGETPGVPVCHVPQSGAVSTQHLPTPLFHRRHCHSHQEVIQIQWVLYFSALVTVVLQSLRYKFNPLGSKSRIWCILTINLVTFSYKKFPPESTGHHEWGTVIKLLHVTHVKIKYCTEFSLLWCTWILQIRELQILFDVYMYWKPIHIVWQELIVAIPILHVHVCHCVTINR